MSGDFLALSDFSGGELLSLMDSADSLRDLWHAGRMPQHLHARNVALVWDAGGFRNRVAFELGIAAMGGRSVRVPGKLDVREPIEDVVRYLQNWFHAIVARTETHQHMLRLAQGADVPVINARTDHNHPCEVLADLTFVRAGRGSIDGLRVAFIGEATNLCYPWFEAASRLPISVVQVCPKGYEADSGTTNALREGAVGTIEISSDLDGSLRGADVVYTDCWPTRPTAEEQAAVRSAFLPYQITTEKLGLAGPKCFFLPCPPVTRGQEVSSEAMETSGATVYQAKEYLLHAQNAVLVALVSSKRGQS
jgi:ornithine carbamoyltransferase